MFQEGSKLLKIKVIIDVKVIWCESESNGSQKGNKTQSQDCSGMKASSDISHRSTHGIKWTKRNVRERTRRVNQGLGRRMEKDGQVGDVRE